MLSQQCPPTTITLLLTTKLTVPEYLQRVCQSSFFHKDTGEDGGLLKTLWKKMEESGRKWKIFATFVPDSVKEQLN